MKRTYRPLNACPLYNIEYGEKYVVAYMAGMAWYAICTLTNIECIYGRLWQLFRRILKYRLCQ